MSRLPQEVEMTPSDFFAVVVLATILLPVPILAWLDRPRDKNAVC